MRMPNTLIPVGYGGGIGPEIMAAVLGILKAAGAAIETEPIEIGPASVEHASWESLRRTRVFLKAPTVTPAGGPYRNFNVTARQTLARRNTDLVGLDDYVEWLSRNPGELAALLTLIDARGLQLDMLANRGVKVWPAGIAGTFCTDTFRCRFLVDQGGASHRQVLELLARIVGAGLEIVKTEYLRRFDGQPGFTAA